MLSGVIRFVFVPIKKIFAPKGSELITSLPWLFGPLTTTSSAQVLIRIVTKMENNIRIIELFIMNSTPQTIHIICIKSLQILIILHASRLNI